MKSRKQKITIFDVAERAGVAISTVSRVINNSPLVKDETRERVVKAMKELQFRPNRTAKSLAQKANVPVVAVAVPSFTTRFYNALLKGVKRGLGDKPVDMLIFDMGFEHPDINLISFLDRGVIDGVLLATSSLSDELADVLTSMHMPIVTVGVQTPYFDAFSWNNKAGVEAAIQHLLDQNHKHIGMIAAHTWNVNASVRLNTFQEMLEKAGITFQQRLVQRGNTKDFAGYSEEAGYEAMQELLEVAPEITAVFAASDVQAIGAWKAITDIGLKIPDDIALIGYDNVKTTEYIGLSSVDQQMGIVGEEAILVLMKRIQGDTAPLHQKIITPKLIARSSSRYLLG